MRIVLIIPTFNESGNIGRLLDELQVVFRSIRHEMLILVELPVEFVDRTVGESKFGIRDILEFLRSAAWIRFQSCRVFRRA